MRQRDDACGARRLGRAIGERLNYANVVATMALIVAVGTGGAYAASQIGPKDIQKNAVRAKHIKKNQVKAKHLAKNAVGTPQIRDGAVTAAKLADGVEGLQGPAGPKGDKGGPGASSLAADCSEGLAAGDVMVRVGPLCMDRYEVSVWSQPNGGVQYGVSSDDYPSGCLDNGNGCKGQIYARSVAGVRPSTFITWYQAQQALANSGKRLPTSAEWQMAAAGTPDPGDSPGPTDCATAGAVVAAGSRSTCISAWGINDMVGNTWEWVADWDEEGEETGTLPLAYGNDEIQIGHPTPTGQAGAMLRGGNAFSNAGAGVFALITNSEPSDSNVAFGFRGVR